MTNLSSPPTSSPPSMSFTPQANRDYLTVLSPEIILLHIIPCLATKDFLAFTRTCKTINNLMPPIFKHFCNLRILENPTYAKASQILNSTYKDGWLVPCYSEIRRVEERQRKKAEEDEETAFRKLRKPLPPRSDFSKLIKLSEPGPQYLLFLECYSYGIVSNDAFGRHVREEGSCWSTSFRGWDDGAAVYAGWFVEWLEQCECRWKGEIEKALVEKGRRFGEGVWAVGSLLERQWPLAGCGTGAGERRRN